MPAHSPTSENIKYGPNLETIQEIPSEEAPTGTTNRSAFFSPTNIAIALVGVGLVVTAYFSAPLAIAAICTLGLTGLAYGAAQYFSSSETANISEAGSEAGNGETNEHDDKNETNEQTSSFDKIKQALPRINEEAKGQRTPSPVSEMVEKEVQEQPQRERSDSDASAASDHSEDSHHSITSNGM